MIIGRLDTMLAAHPPEVTRQFVHIAGHRLEVQWVGESFAGTPMVFLHEGLGSIDLWRDFPNAVAAAVTQPALVYSRYGNGWSDPLTEPRRPEYLHEEALVVLPELIESLVGRPPVLIGHSDGASIAIIYSGSGRPVEGLVLVSPHVFVEEQGLEAISSIGATFPTSELPTKLAKYHAEPETTFWGWNDVWLSREFRDWNIEEYLHGISCPVLLIQGSEDEYGTAAQLDVIEAGMLRPLQRMIVPESGHSPHLAQSEEVVAAVARFIGDLNRS